MGESHTRHLTELGLAGRRHDASTLNKLAIDQGGDRTRKNAELASHDGTPINFNYYNSFRMYCQFAAKEFLYSFQIMLYRNGLAEITRS
jgi:hypothetical protein